MFSRYEFILNMSECFHHHHCLYNVKNEKTEKHYTIVMEDSNFRNDAVDIMVFENKKGTPELALQFFQIPYNDNDEIDKVIKRIENEINLKQKSLEDIIKDYENGKIDFKECNRQAKELEDR